MARMRIKRGDKVVVIAGKAKGTGPVEVLRVDREKRKVVVQGVNLRFKHIRKSQQNPKGGRIRKELPIDASNVMLWSEKLKKGVRVKIVEKNGRKIRVGIPCGTEFDK